MEPAVAILLVVLFVLSVALALTRWLVPKALAEEPAEHAGSH